MSWPTVVAVLGGLGLVWFALVAALIWVARKQHDPTRLVDVLRLVPDVLRLCRALAADPALPTGVRVRMALLCAYLLLPFDLVPDFIPVVGYADDAIVTVWALRSVARAAGPGAIDRHWKGTTAGLAAVKRLAGLPS